MYFYYWELTQTSNLDEFHKNLEGNESINSASIILFKFILSQGL